MLYFAYGSNMSILRLQARVPSALKIDTAKLTSHEIRFHKKSTHDFSAKCDAKKTDNTSHYIIGVLFQISKNERHCLDRAEGLGHGYETKLISVETSKGELVEAFTYYATLIDTNLKPYSWYKEHVVRGAKENKLPQHYIEMLHSVESIIDPETSRHELELSIYLKK